MIFRVIKAGFIGLAIGIAAHTDPGFWGIVGCVCLAIIPMNMADFMERGER